MKPDENFGVLTGNSIDTQSFKAGSAIFREGDEAHELFVIKSGQVRIHARQQDDQRTSARTTFSARWR